MKFSDLSIIIAEDDADDRLLIQDALHENQIEKRQIIFAEDGEELLHLLKGNDYHPHIIFLDLNMPRKDGRQALKEIKSDENLKHIPVIIFTTSSSDEDIFNCYHEGSNTYFTKPARFQELVEIVKVIKSYWMEKASYIRRA